MRKVVEFEKGVYQDCQVEEEAVNLINELADVQLEDDTQKTVKEEVSDKPIKELLFGGGAGGVSFEMGYSHALIEIVGKEKLREYKLGGVSCGTAVAGYFHLALWAKDSDTMDMKASYQRHLRRFFQKENKKYFGLFTSGKLIHEFATTYWEEVEEHIKAGSLSEDGHTIPPINGKIHVSISTVEGMRLKKNIVNEFADAADFAEAVEASCTLPFFTRFGMFASFREKLSLDGGFTSSIPYQHEDSEKIFLNVLPRFTRYWQQFWDPPKNLQCLDITEGTGMKFPLDYWLWSEHWSDEMFLKGYLTAHNSKEKICKVFGVEVK